MDGLAVGVEEELEEAESSFEYRSAVSQRPFYRVPEAQFVVGERDDPDAGQFFPEGPALSEVGPEAEVKRERNDRPAVKGIDLDSEDARFVHPVHGVRNEERKKAETDEQEIEGECEEAATEGGQLDPAEGFLAAC